MGTIPIYRDTHMTLLSDIDEITEFDRAFCKISNELGLPVRTGSLLRVSEEAYDKWDIRTTPENREALWRASECSYLTDVKDQMDHPDIDIVLKTERRMDIERGMSRLMAALTKTFLIALGERRDRLSVCDIPARDGKLSCAIASQIRYKAESFFDRTEFHLVDCASPKLAVAQESMKLRMPAERIHTYCNDNARFVDEMQNAKFDIIVSLSHLHHKSFLTDYLRKLHGMLADDGVLIIGDWHSAIFHHPDNTKRLLRRIGANERKLDELNSHFGPELMAPDRNVKLRPDECAAIEEHFDYWEGVADKVRRSSVLSRMRIHFLEAHDTSKARRMKLDEAGFTTDLDRIRAAFPGTKLEKLPRKVIPGSDFAVVMVAMKRPAERSR